MVHFNNNLLFEGYFLDLRYMYMFQGIYKKAFSKVFNIEQQIIYRYRTTVLYIISN